MPDGNDPAPALLSRETRRGPSRNRRLRPTASNCREGPNAEESFGVSAIDMDWGDDY